MNTAVQKCSGEVKQTQISPFQIKTLRSVFFFIDVAADTGNQLSLITADALKLALVRFLLRGTQCSQGGNFVMIHI